jgi:hypothetical protein
MAKPTVELPIRHAAQVRQTPAEQTELPKNVSFEIAGLTAKFYPAYKKPSDVMFERAKSKVWRARRDSNLRRLAGVT